MDKTVNISLTSPLSVYSPCLFQFAFAEQRFFSRYVLPKSTLAIISPLKKMPLPSVRKRTPVSNQRQVDGSYESPPFRGEKSLLWRNSRILLTFKVSHIQPRVIAVQKQPSLQGNYSPVGLRDGVIPNKVSILQLAKGPHFLVTQLWCWNGKVNNMLCIRNEWNTWMRILLYHGKRVSLN